MRPNSVRRFILFNCLFIIVLVLSGCGGFEWTKQQTDDINSRYMFSKEFDTNIVHASVTYGGVLQIQTASDKQGTMKNHFINAGTGNIILSGEAGETALISDTDPVVFVSVRGEEHSLRAMSRAGKKLWERNYKSGFMTSTATPARDELLILSSAPSKKSTTLILRNISLKNGKTKWETNLAAAVKTLAVSSGDVMSSGKDAVYLVLGASIACVDLSTGKLLWDAKLEAGRDRNEAPRYFWELRDDMAVVAFGNSIVALSRKDGVLWHKTVENNSLIHDLVWTEKGIVTGYHTDKTSTTALFSQDTGNIEWRHKIDGAGFLNGIAASDGKVIYSAGGKLLLLSISDGKILYEATLDKKASSDYGNLIPGQGHVVLLGRHYIEARSVKDGGQLWHHGPYQSPWEMHMAGKRSTMAVAAAVLSFSQAMNAAPGEYLKPYSEQSYSYRQYGHLINISKDSTKAMKGLFVPVLAVSSQYPSKYAWFVEAANKVTVSETFPGSHSYVILADLHDGRIRQVPLFPSKFCSINAVVDESGGRIMEVYSKSSVLCKEIKKIDVFRLD